ncbi:MAG: ABC transporter substrate-binding protein [Methanomicrobiales archaeon]|nr:ABC transporter substrate-binding protein [Methanomicrobiales archaeon]
MKKVILCIGLLVIFGLIAGCATTQIPQKGELKVGVIASMTGPASTTGKDIWQSAVLAADEINAQGGVFVKELNKKVQVVLIQGDDESTREGGQKAVSKLITQDGVDVLVGGFSSAVVSAHQSIVAEQGVPYIVSGGSSTSVSRRTDIDMSSMFFHRPNTDDSAQVTTLFASEVIRPAINAKFSFPESRRLRMAVIYQDSPYGKGQLSAMNATITGENLPIQVVAQESYTMGSTDFRTQMTKIKAANPDVIYAASFLNEQIPLVQQARRDVGMDTIILAIEPCDDPDYYSGTGRYGEFSILESRFSPYAVPRGSTSVAIQQFVQNFDKKWQGFPGMMGAATYESIYITKEAVEKAGTMNRSKVQEALATIEVPQMMEAMKGGKITFANQYHESKFDLYMEQLIWDDSAGELRPKIVWPEALKETDFVLPDWYKPGTG